MKTITGPRDTWIETKKGLTYLDHKGQPVKEDEAPEKPTGTCRDCGGWVWDSRKLCGACLIAGHTFSIPLATR